MLSKGCFSAKGGAVGVLLFAMLILPLCLGFRDAFSAKYVQLDVLIPGVFFLIFALFVLYIGGKEYAAIDVYSNHIKIKWLWGLISTNILPSGITYFSLCMVNNANCLVLKTPNYDYIIPKELLNNVHDIATQLKKWQVKRRDNITYSFLSNTQKKVMAVYCLFLGVTLLILAANTKTDDYTAIDKARLVLLKGHLKGHPVVTKPSGKNSRKDITFSLKEYREFSFAAGATGYNAADKRGLEFYLDGSETELAINRREFDVKLAHTAEPTFNEKHYDWNTITVYHATVNEYKVLTLDNYNAQWIKNNNGYTKIFTILSGLTIIGFSARALLKKPSRVT